MENGPFQERQETGWGRHHLAADGGRGWLGWHGEWGWGSVLKGLTLGRVRVEDGKVVGGMTLRFPPGAGFMEDSVFLWFQLREGQKWLSRAWSGVSVT